nr:hypothetical protein [Tanacetum cinerariifolium]
MLGQHPLAVWSIAADYLVSDRYPGVQSVCNIGSWPNVRAVYGPDIVKLSKKEIDNILRGPKDSNNAASGRIILAVLQQLIFEHLEKMERDCRGVDQVMHLKSLVSQHVVNMHLETQNIISQDKNTLSGKADQTLEIQKTISEYILRMSDETQNLRKYEAGKEDQAVKQLQVVISMNITRMHGAISLKDKYSSRVMFIAAEVGNTNFLLALIRRSLDLIWKVNDNGLSIFHVAVKNRHEGMSTRKKNLDDVSGAALQMQRDLLWFKEVERIIPPSYRERKNKDGFTPRELFTMEHQYLIAQVPAYGGKYLFKPANQVLFYKIQTINYCRLPIVMCFTSSTVIARGHWPRLGLLQPLIDGFKLIIKEPISPSSANFSLSRMAPMATFMLSLVARAVVPFDYDQEEDQEEG